MPRARSAPKGKKGKRKPPVPKSTRNMPPGLKAYWQARGVGAGGAKTGTTTNKKRKSRSKTASSKPRVHVRVTAGGKTTTARA